MHYRLLGDLEVQAEDGTVVAIPAPKRRELLAVLLLSSNRPVSVERLCEALWESDQPPAAHQSLHAHVSRLRREIGPDHITTEPSGYWLRLDGDELDTLVAESTITVARQAAADGQWRPAAEAFGRAIDLWRGPSLADFTTRAFARPEIARLDELYASAIEGRIEAELALGRHVKVVAELERLVAGSPYHEHLWELLMLALYRSGRQADALEAYRRVRAVLRSELGIDPAPALEALQQRILRQDRTISSPSTGDARVRLPALDEPLVGRAEISQQAIGLLKEHRLVTLTGPGGVGKTRLSIGVAHAVVSEYPDGVVFVDLSAVREASVVLARIGEQIGGGDRPAEVIGDRKVLLVLDNFEQVLDAAPGIGALLDACPNLRTLVTSRSRLRLRRERRLEVPPLSNGDASRLFATRSQAVLASGRLDEGLVDEIVTHLDCLPLAVELAAAQMAAIAPIALLDRLEAGLALRADGPRDSPERHRTLNRTIAWSDDLLSPQARAAFRALSVFPGGFGIDAALAVADADVEVIGELVDHSLARVQDGRYSMLETIRQFARAEADRDGVTASAQDRHLGHFRSLPAAAQLVDGIPGGRPKAWYDLCRIERENFRVAFDWAVQRADDGAVVQLFRDMGMYWGIVGSIADGWRWSQRAIDAASGLDPETRMIVLMTAAEFPKLGGSLETALELKHQGLRLARQLGHHLGITSALVDIAWIHAAVGEDDRAAAYIAESMALHDDPACDPIDHIFGLSVAAEVSLRAGRMEDAQRSVDAIAELEARTKVPRDWASGMETARGTVLLASGNRTEAADAFRRAVRAGAELEYRILVADALEGLASLALDDDAEVAARLIGMADRIRAEANSRPWLAERRAATINTIRERLGEEAYAAARARGHALSLPEIAAEVLESG